MRSIAVHEENTMVARVTPHSMNQDRDETIRSVDARLRGQAGVCKFTFQCTADGIGYEQDVNYTCTKAMIRYVVTRGLFLCDHDIQLDSLGEKMFYNSLRKRKQENVLGHVSWILKVQKQHQVHTAKIKEQLLRSL